MTREAIRPRRVLFVDDVVPDPALGSGHPRLVETLETIQSMPGVTVALYPTIDIIYPANEFGALRPWQGKLPLEIITGEIKDHLKKIAAGGELYDVVVISRPHNYEFVIDDIRRYLPEVPVIYDAEALFYRRMERQLELIPKKDRPLLVREAKKMRTLEEKIAREADELVLVSPEEAEILRPLARGPLTINSPLLGSTRWTERSFAERDGVGFIAGWASGPKSPNIDGMQWFAREVWPRVLARSPDAKLKVTGGSPPVEVRRFECASIDFVGNVKDLNDFYASLRVIVVPNRFGAGVKNKTIEALQCGVPTVSTAVGAEGVPIPGFVDGTTGREPWSPSYLTVTDDATEFAERIVELCTDRSVFEGERELLRRQCEEWAREQRHIEWPAIIDRAVPPVALVPGKVGDLGGK